MQVLDNGVTSNEYWRILDCDESLEWCACASAPRLHLRPPQRQHPGAAAQLPLPHAVRRARP